MVGLALRIRGEWRCLRESGWAVGIFDTGSLRLLTTAIFCVMARKGAGFVASIAHLFGDGQEELQTGEPAGSGNTCVIKRQIACLFEPYEWLLHEIWQERCRRRKPSRD